MSFFLKLLVWLLLIFSPQYSQTASSQGMFSNGGALFHGLSDLAGGDFSSMAQKVSADGKVVAGTGMTVSGSQAFVWTAESGIVGLGNVPDDRFIDSWAYGISDNGAVIVGAGNSGSSWETRTGFVWTEENGMQVIGSLNGSTRFEVFATCSNGSVIAGDGGQQAFLWKKETGIIGLGVLPGRNRSRAVDVSADGSVVVGSSYNLPDWDSEQAFRWTSDKGMAGLGFLPGGQRSFALAVSGDGNVIIGTGDSSFGYAAFRWTQETGMIPIGHLLGKSTTHPEDLNANGSVIVGGSYGPGGTDPQAFIWDKTHGMRILQQVLQTEYQLDLAGWTLHTAKGMTPDGKVIVGWGKNPDGQQEAFRVILDRKNVAPGQ